MPMEIVWIAAALAVGGYVLLSRINQKLSRQGRQLDALFSHFGVVFPRFPPASAAVLELLAQADGKIAAIRQYRKETGLGLAEAHAAVEALAASLSKRGD